MSVDVLDDTAGLLGGEVMADSTIWVDRSGQPWRRSSGHYERLTELGWVIDSPRSPLRKSTSVPAPDEPGPEGPPVVIGQADDNTYFVKGEKGDRGVKGDKGDPGEQGEQGLPGEGTIPTVVYGEIPAGVVDGVNTIFVTAHAYIADTAVVFRNGLREVRGIGYIESGLNEITITTAPDTEDDVIVDYVMA